MNINNRLKRHGVLDLGIILLIAVFITSCSKTEKKLPIFGERDWVTKTVDGKEVVDTIYHQIPAFKFVNQNSDTITEASVADKIYVADFFFTSCPTICPVMKRQMLKVHEAFKDNDQLKILSHTIDPDHDTPEVLNTFAKDLGVTGDQWWFLTGPKEQIYEIGQKFYMTPAQADSTAQGGYIHGGYFILCDKDRHVRGMYDGTTEEGTQKLITDINILLKEYE
ncbi:protein SCO1/2 [Dyadobacter jejuensis]|uniref:Protein SCO1/2 n=1 Tax=Dyadobacter jejuensis TaxID=1082580 RepID=A0A316AIP4_9BACT|nr:SCO family protein [Dyadobacter jejuensis]PWJ57109.1 protein SCO1/2 [Dyadobacter jejuensis]